MGQARRILIVDDEPNVRLVFLTALESNDWTVATADDGETALRWLEQDPADLVLLDLCLPGIGGMEVLATLRRKECDVPVVIVTAHDSVANAVEAMRLGATDFVGKPLTPGRLRRVVADVLARHDQDQNGSGRPSDMLASAKRALNHRLFFRADALLREAIKEHPESAEPWYLLGVLMEVQNKPHAASEAYRSALSIDPDYWPAKLHRLKFDASRT
jgi:DNA-binding NtrC family response regulator